MNKTFKVTGKATFADGASDNTEYGTADKRTLSIAEIGFDLQVDRQQTKVEDMGGALGAGDTYILFAALRITMKSKLMTLASFVTSLMGTDAAAVGDYTPLTLMDPSVKNRVGACKLALYHPILGPTTPAIMTPASSVMLYQALAPDSALTSGAESEGEFSFVMDVPDAQVIHIHKDMLNTVSDIS